MTWHWAEIEGIRWRNSCSNTPRGKAVSKRYQNQKGDIHALTATNPSSNQWGNTTISGDAQNVKIRTRGKLSETNATIATGPLKRQYTLRNTENIYVQTHRKQRHPKKNPKQEGKKKTKRRHHGPETRTICMDDKDSPRNKEEMKKGH